MRTESAQYDQLFEEYTPDAEDHKKRQMFLRDI